MADLWYVAQGSTPIGPFAVSQLREQAASGKLKPETMILKQGTTVWMKAADARAHLGEDLFAPKPAAKAQPAAALADDLGLVPIAVAPAARPEVSWFYLDKGQRQGPVSVAQLKSLIKGGKLGLDGQVWNSGLAAWTEVRSLKELAAAAALPESIPVLSPASIPPLLAPAKPDAGWHHSRPGQPAQGPVSFERLKQLAGSGELKETDLIWRNGMDKWLPAADIKDLFPEKPKGNVFSSLWKKVQETAATAAAAAAAAKPSQAPAPSPPAKPSQAAAPSAPAAKATKPEPPPAPARTGVLCETRAAYRGGHPTLPSAARGLLLIGSVGVEFIPDDASTPPLRIGYGAMRRVGEPVKGAFPEEMVKASETKKTAGKVLGFASGLLGRASDSTEGAVAGFAGKVVGQGIAQSAKLGPPPDNRLVVVAIVDGNQLKLRFDAVGASKEEMETLARQFWSQALAVKDRFGSHSADEEDGLPGGDRTALLGRLKEFYDLIEELRDAGIFESGEAERMQKFVRQKKQFKKLARLQDSEESEEAAGEGEDEYDGDEPRDLPLETIEDEDDDSEDDDSGDCDTPDGDGSGGMLDFLGSDEE